MWDLDDATQIDLECLGWEGLTTSLGVQFTLVNNLATNLYIVTTPHPQMPSSNYDLIELFWLQDHGET